MHIQYFYFVFVLQNFRKKGKILKFLLWGIYTFASELTFVYLFLAQICSLNTNFEIFDQWDFGCHHMYQHNKMPQLVFAGITRAVSVFLCRAHANTEIFLHSSVSFVLQEEDKPLTNFWQGANISFCMQFRSLLKSFSAKFSP